jgi:TRAP transporter 4TM/12TM fusion protein
VPSNTLKKQDSGKNKNIKAFTMEKMTKQRVIPEERVHIFDDDSFFGITIGNRNVIKKIIFIMGFIAGIIPILEVIFGPLMPGYQRTVHMFLIVSITFFLYPSDLFKNRKYESVFNIILVLMMAFVCSWASYRWTYFYMNPSPEPIESLFGLIFVLLVFEATRRSIGAAMSIIGAAFIIYCFAGPYVPRYFAHPGYSPSELVTHLIVGVEGMMGELAAISATQIVFFMMFAAFLQMTKSTDILMDFSKAIAGHRVGGPAKIAVVSSGFMGMVSGSASGNTATTGAVTIPLMISLGFKKHIAAAIEAVASTAGQFMPPIMGATAFVIAEYTNNSYWDIAIAAFIPSAIYFVIMFFVVDILSRKDKIPCLDKNQLPHLGRSFSRTIPILIPILILVVMLAKNISVQMSIIVTLVSLVLICIPIREQRIGIKKILRAISLTAKILIPITTSCAVAGLIVGVMTLTGFGERLSYGIIVFSQGKLLLGLIFTAIVCLILGMGLPTLGAYVVLSTLGAPALVQLGAPVLAAHMFIFYFAIISAITPPVCLSAYVGASIAGANPMKVGYTSMILAPFIYVLPFMFVYDTGLLMEGSFIGITVSVLKALLLLVTVTVLIQRFWISYLKFYEIILLSFSILILIYTRNYLIFSILFAMIFIYHSVRTRYLGKVKDLIFRKGSTK